MLSSKSSEKHSTVEGNMVTLEFVLPATPSSRFSKWMTGLCQCLIPYRILNRVSELFAPQASVVRRHLRDRQLEREHIHSSTVRDAQQRYSHLARETDALLAAGLPPNPSKALGLGFTANPTAKLKPYTADWTIASPVSALDRRRWTDRLCGDLTARS